ncbi:MAG: endolytic transglycosylase MltG [Desulfovibrio sp.]|nr:endolytic transglycosylase MltG [Desulfovibrio sp.]
MPDTYLLKKPEETSAQVYEKKEEAEVKTEGQSEGNTEAKTKGNTEVKTKDQAKERTKDQTAEKVNVVVEEKIESQEDPENRQAWLIAGRLVDNFWQKSKALWPNQKKPERQALVRLVVLASIVEKETAKASERARIAGVYNNRLEKQMLLQADPTVIYGLGPSFQGRLLKRHLEDVKNPYNTYQHPGLPPGPICSFGLGALAAALKPEQHSFLYFVASEDGGAHVFSKRLEEHNVAVQKYRKRTREKKAEQERAR